MNISTTCLNKNPPGGISREMDPHYFAGDLYEVSPRDNQRITEDLLADQVPPSRTRYPEDPSLLLPVPLPGPPPDLIKKGPKTAFFGGTPRVPDKARFGGKTSQNPQKPLFWEEAQNPPKSTSWDPPGLPYQRLIKTAAGKRSFFGQKTKRV